MIDMIAEDILSGCRPLVVIYKIDNGYLLRQVGSVNDKIVYSRTAKGMANAIVSLSVAERLLEPKQNPSHPYPRNVATEGALASALARAGQQLTDVYTTSIPSSLISK